MRQLPNYDDRMNMTRDAARKQDKVLRYVGSIDVSTRAIKVGLEHVEKGSPLANLHGSQIVSIYTKRYAASPLVLQGGGGGGEITAMGVMADLLRVMERLRSIGHSYTWKEIGGLKRSRCREPFP